MTMVGIIGVLLRMKDAQQARQIEIMETKVQVDHEFQAKQIALLFAKHDDDAYRLDQFQLQIAREHYVKQELDARFDRLEAAFTRGFSDLGTKIDKLADVILHSGNGK